MVSIIYRLWVSAALILLTGLPSLASSIIPPKDFGELVRLSDLVVIAKAGEAEGFRRGEIVMTGTSFEVIQVLKGSLAIGQSFTVETIGGIAGEFGLHISGSPQFASGKIYLLSLTQHNGAWVPRVMSYGLLVEHTLPSGEKAFTHMAEVHELNVVIPDGLQVETVGMYKANALLTHIKQIVGGLESWNKDRAGYLNDMVHEHTEAPMQLNGLPGPIVPLSAPPSGCEYMSYGGTKIRWDRFATDQSVNVNLTYGAPATAVTAAQTAVSGWKALSGIDVSSLTYNGAAAAAATCSSGSVDINRITSYNANIFLDDPCNEITDLSSCAGTLAVAGPGFDTGVTHSFNSENWITALVGYMIINNGTPGCLSATQYNQVVTHELGHIIGFGHHTGGAANMNANCCNAISTLDQTCAVYIYSDGSTSNPVPTITSIAPTSAAQGTSGVSVVVTGTNFMAGGTVAISGSGITITSATLISATRIDLIMNIAAAATTGVRNITVTNPAPGGGASNAGSFTITAAATTPPTVTTAAVSGVTSSSATAGGDVTSQGSASVTDRGVCYATTTNPTTSNSCVSSGSGTGSFSASLSGLSASTTYYVRAYAINSAGTAYGANVSFTTSSASNPTPSITSVSPSSFQSGTSTSFVINGTNFVSGATIAVIGNSVGGTEVSVSSVQFVSSTQITAILTVASGVSAGTRGLRMTNPAPGGGNSNLVNITITQANNPSPTFTTLSPNSGTQGTTVNVTVTGTGFTSQSSIGISGTGISINNLTIVSATQITASFVISGNAATGARNVTITNPTPGGGTSTSLPFTVNPAFVNKAPTLNPIANISFLHTAQVQNIVLSGITAGEGESQTLAVTATADNPLLIPYLVIEYTSPQTNGLVKLLNDRKRVGSTIIRVKVKDNGGTANAGVDSLVRVFTVNVLLDTDLEVDEAGVPKTYFLSQNYPNPFNPTTQIRFALPKSSWIRLSVYDLMGRERMILAEGDFSAGQHTLSLDAKGLASGTYIYTLRAADYSSSKKLTLLK